MIRIFRRFFDFCGETNKRKFTKSIFLGVLKALFEALKIPAIAVTLQGVLSGNLTAQHILLSLGIMLFSIAGNAFANYRSTMLQCEAGYGTCADKRIEIAEHLKYLPMGYFNQNSLGYITSVATNSMEALADVATRVVTQGILTTAVVVLMIYTFDLRIGGIAILGVLLFFAVNSLLQKKAKEIAPTKDASDRKLVEKVLEYIQGIAEVKSYNLTGEKSKALNRAVDENTAANIKLEITFVPPHVPAKSDSQAHRRGHCGRIRCVLSERHNGAAEYRGHGYCRLYPVRCAGQCRQLLCTSAKC